MVEQSEQSLSKEEKTQLFALLLQNHTLFATGADDLGHTARIQHKINSGTTPPIRQSVWHMPQLCCQEAKELLDDMLSRSVILPSSSPWASPVITSCTSAKRRWVTKVLHRLYQKVNAVTRKDAYPLPRVDNTLDTLSGSKWFSTLDLLSGNWQVEVSPEDQEKNCILHT